MQKTSNEELQIEVKELRRRLVEADEMLRAERRMFQATAETFADVVFTALPDGSWDFVNERIYEITGLPPGSALGNGWTKALHPDDLARVMRDMEEALATGTPFESHFRLQSPQGTHRRVVARAHALCDESGRIVRWVGTAMDVHDQLTAEDALQELGQQRNEFVSKLVHDLRNAAAPIQHAVAILKDPRADAGQRQRAVEIIDGQVRELRVLLDKVREASGSTRK